MSAQAANRLTKNPRELPEEEISAQLRAWWSSEVEQSKEDPFANAKVANKGTLYDLVAEVDSLSVTNALLVVEGILGLEVPVKLIKRGGYCHCEEMIRHLLAGIRNCARRGELKLLKKKHNHAIRIEH